MTALAASDVTLTIEDQSIERKHKRNRVKIVFGDGVLTYPAGGVPLPTYGNWGMVRNLDIILPSDGASSSGIIWKYDRTNNKLRGFIQGLIVGAAGAVTVDDFPLDTTAEPLASTVSLSLTNNTGAGTKYIGKLVELATGATPVSQTLVVEAVGW